MTLRDYSNMPAVRWEGRTTALRAKAQILHEEPVVLLMGEGFDLSVDHDACHCHVDEASGILYSCEPRQTLESLAEKNDEPELAILAEAAVEASQVVDLDAAGARIIIHD